MAKSKVMTVSEAVGRFISDGTHIGFGGFSLCRNAMVVSHEIIRQGKKNLKISSVNPAYGVDILIGAGLVESVESGCLNMERLGLPRNFCRAVEEGRLKSEDYEHGAMTFRYLAGALGLPFIPTKSLLGSDILKYQVLDRKKFEYGTSPFNGEKVVLLPPCNPDVSVIHVTRADEQGNCQIDGSAFCDEYIAKASSIVIVVAEQLVDDETIRRDPGVTVIPAHCVSAVVHAPWGAYPTAVPGCYDYDYEYINYYQACAKKSEAFSEYLKKYVFGVKDFDQFLEIAGTPITYRRLAIDPRLGYSRYTAEMVTGASGGLDRDPGVYTNKELMIIAAAREIRDGDKIIAGTGLPMAATTLAKLTHAPDCLYVVETGIGDVNPVHSSLSVADPRLAGAARPSFVRNTLEGLGFFVHRGHADVGFLGGAEIDIYGNLNATALGDDYFLPKKRLPGSGGANVIASCAGRVMVIMKHEKRRFKKRVDYITSPGFVEGGNSRAECGLTGGGPYRVITDLGVMGFDAVTKRMMVISLHPGVTQEQIQEATGFDLIFPDQIAVTPLPTEEELAILRANVSEVYLSD
ncbi:MAG: CoA-transferase [Desulfocucumaceae bacterium]